MHLVRLEIAFLVSIIVRAEAEPYCYTREMQYLNFPRVVHNILCNLCIRKDECIIFNCTIVHRTPIWINLYHNFLAVHPMPGTAIYTSTKFAVHGFIRALYEELRQDGIDFIKLTSVLPYFVSTRKDLMATVNLRFPVITAEEVADVTVDAMLRNELIVSVPRCNLWISSMLSFLSLSNQNLIRDHVLKERETRQMFYVEKDKLVDRVDN